MVWSRPVGRGGITLLAVKTLPMRRSLDFVALPSSCPAKRGEQSHLGR